MAVIKKIVQGLRNALSKPEERGEYSSGYLPYIVREETKKLVGEDPDTILEIGSGEGLFIESLTKAYPSIKVFGIEPGKDMISKAKERTAGFNQVGFIYGIAQDLPVKNNTIGGVVCLNLIINIPDKGDVKTILSEMLRVCRPGGKIYFDFRNTYNPLVYFGYKLAFLHDPDIKVPLNTYTLKQIKNILLEIGIEKIEYIPLGFPHNIFAPVILIAVEKENTLV